MIKANELSLGKVKDMASEMVINFMPGLRWKYKEFQIKSKGLTCKLLVPRGAQGEDIIKKIQGDLFMYDRLKFLLDYTEKTNGDSLVKNILQNAVKTLDIG